MKIYFAYRSAYQKNSRYIKEFEADSVLDWFQSNWEVLQEEIDCEATLLGVDVYGFPMEDEIRLDEGQKIRKPKTFAQLIARIKRYVYLNEIKANVNCIQVLTDDDEIELAWYVFDEDYAQNNQDKVALWFNKYLPSTYGQTGKKLGGKYIEITPKGKEKGCIYYGSSPVYDGGNFESLEGLYKIENVRLPSFLNYLRNTQIGAKGDTEYVYGYDELRFIQFVANQIPTASISDIVEILGKIPFTELEDIDYDNLNEHSLSDILETQTQNNEPAKTAFAYISEHCYEWNTVVMDEFHNYIVLFDDLWIEENEHIAKNLAKFMKTWQL